jgi:hypothetical protein
VGTVGVLVTVAACTGGGSFGVTGSGGVSSSGAGGFAPSPGANPVSGVVDEEPPGARIPEMPVVACSSPLDGGSDGGLDDASAPVSDDGGPGDSPCSAPPPSECTSKTEMAIWGPGDCRGEQCAFTLLLRYCPGGCFRQVDGGNGCNE